MSIALTACSHRGTVIEARGPARGGTLRLVIPADFGFGGLPDASDATVLDPQLGWDPEVFRCCLSRTLMSYAIGDSPGGADVLEPDLAASRPTVAADGLTWTFHLRAGIRYAPPFDDHTVTAPDIVRAVERAIAAADEQASFDVIEGAADFRAGRTTSISGLEVPDSLTLVVRVTRPSGDIGSRFAIPASAPLPAVALAGGSAGAPLLASTGPYMVEGSDRLDPRRSRRQQGLGSGFRPGHSLTLVRNPSWSSRADRLRPAYVDRIEFSVVPSLKEAAREVDTGEADLVFAYGAPPQIPSEQTERYANSTSLKKRLLVNEQGTMRMIVMNLAVPPFDDVHVRRAVNLAVDKRQLRELAGGKFYARIAGHIIPNRLEGNLLVDYDPYRTPDAGGDLGAARREMARSRYDHDHDGRCDDPVCRDVRGLTRSSDYFPEQARVIARNLAPLGIALTVDTQTRAFAIASEPANRVPMMLNVGWGPMYPNAADFFVNLFGGPSLNTSNNNWAHVGATFDQLRQWRSPVTSVPTVDTKIESCEGLIGNAQTSCWAETDQQLMETVVPIVPLAFEYDAHVVSARVTHQDFDRAMASAALDQFAVATR